MMYYNDYFTPEHSFFGPIFMIFIWVLIIWGVVSLVRYLSSQSKDGHGSAMHTLKERFAKGEITKEQFESMKKDL